MQQALLTLKCSYVSNL